jgi:serine O-acetyltransferase
MNKKTKFPLITDPLAEEGVVCNAVEDQAKNCREQLPVVVEAILESCRNDAETMTHVDSELLPSKEEVRRLVRMMMEIVFPGFFGDKLVDRSSLPYYLGEKTAELHDRLAVQIERAIRHECRRTKLSCTHCVELGKSDALAFLKCMPEVRGLAASDVRAAFRGDPAARSYDEVVFCYPGLFAVTVYRLAHVMHNLKVPLLPRIMTEYAHGETGIDIHPGAKIGEEFFVDHGSGVVIGETCEIGKGVTLYQGVTLGALSFAKDESGALVRGTKRHPTIEDEVVIYSGATILGGETIVGKGCVIGGNVWLTRSVPPGTTVTMSSPELVYRQRKD